ncbi:glycoside hydrolase family 3 protein [Brachybacterium sp. GU-2]|uniref:glycoside hydrolase family 3 protein n=1 Tax=Brachybacterium sp. GU-2 TaxID=3069708 RepID=UPI00280BC49C|nr:glycoside hydrolase family 3 N-terminal domain-containing protein [Brachybacterium sp. GU-2]WME21824.1 glycoside hydrolase family 3 N-terminal domain-containing protein [Brachybacterium sp. GU-2]
MPTADRSLPRLLSGVDGTRYRDLNGNGVMDPYEDPRLSAEERTEDLLARLSLEEKVGLLFHTVIETGPDGTLLETPGAISKSPTTTVVSRKLMTHFNVHGLESAEAAARWHNRLQQLAETTPHGIPVTISTDPRHGGAQNAGTSWATSFFSLWPEPLGLGALHDPELVRVWADTVRREYTAVGIRAGLHPVADLATEPRWARQRECFSQDPELTAELVGAALEGLAGEEGEPSVQSTVKHFPGAGPQRDGEDAHFPYGRDQVYPGGRFEDHLLPFRVAIDAGAEAIMPYYGRPVGLVRDGEAIEAVGFGFNRQVLTGLLRGELGYEGVIVSDWELVNDNHVGDQVLPARAWGVEELTPSQRMERILEAGADQFGGEECTELLLDLVREGAVAEERITDSARRLLRVKFRLGLFDDPYVDESAAAERVGTEEDRRRGHEAQARSVVVLHDDGGLLPLRPAGSGSGGRLRLYTEGLPEAVVAALGEPVEHPADADLALLRIGAPFQPRDDLFLEAWFHQGDLSFPPGLAHRLARIRAVCPLVLDVDLDRAAVLTDIAPVCDALTGTFGVSGAAWVDAITGRVPAAGRLPLDLPRSMEAVRAAPEDVPGGTANPLYPFGHGMDLAAGPDGHG